MLTLIVLLTSVMSAPQAGGRATSDHESEVLRRLTTERFEANARNDRAFYERLLLPAFMLQDPHSFPPVTKQQYLDGEFVAGRPSRPASRLSEFQALVDGDRAVVRYEIAEPYPIGGVQQFEMRSRRLDT